MMWWCSGGSVVVMVWWCGGGIVVVVAWWCWSTRDGFIDYS